MVSLSDVNRIEPGTLLTVSDTVASDATDAVTDAADAIADVVTSAGIDAVAASSIPMEYLALGAVGVGTRTVSFLKLLKCSLSPI